MDFNAQTCGKIKVLAFMPLGKLVSTNIKFNDTTLVKMCYITTADSLPVLNDYFILTLDEVELREFIRALNLANAGNGMLQKDAGEILAFVEKVKESGESLSIIIPIQLMNTDENLLFGSIMKLTNICDDPEFVFISEKIIDNNEFFEAPISKLRIFLGKKELSSPCELCKLRSRKIGDTCMYKVDSFKCLFNCDIDSQPYAADAQIPGSSLAFTIDMFEHVTKGVDDLEAVLDKDLEGQNK